MFRLWAPRAGEASVVFEDRRSTVLVPDARGVFAAGAEVGAGCRYMFRVDGRDVPDLASRQQAEDAGGWSVVRAELPPPRLGRPVRPWREAIICEVHVGTASPEGTFAGLAQRLEHFRDAGYTFLELMPVNEFPGRRGWGYDGTLIFAPESAYGTPAALRDLVDQAHDLGLGMILDVVYNHFGAVDNFVSAYAPEWFADSGGTPWGPAIEFGHEMVRRFYCENAAMWLSEYDFDGLRLDAVHEIKGAAGDRLLREVVAAARAAKPGAHLIVENLENDPRWLERDDRGEPRFYDAQWHEDTYRALSFLVTGEERRTGYDESQKDPVADLEKALAGSLADREPKDSGSDAPTLSPDCFVTYVENHDQVGNRADARRLASRISPRHMDFLHFVKLLAPQIPLCFMGDEADLDSPFPFSWISHGVRARPPTDAATGRCGRCSARTSAMATCHIPTIPGPSKAPGSPGRS